MFFTRGLGSIIDVEAGEVWSSLRLLQAIKSRVNRYRNLGISPADHVLIIHGNSAEFFADLFAVWSLGACAVCIDNTLGLAEFTPIRQACDARFVIGRRAMPGKLADLVLSDCQFVDTLDEDPIARVGDTLRTPAGSAAAPDRPALILFTSGSTGEPKGVVHTHRTLAAKWHLLRAHVPLEHLDVSLCLLPTHFGHGLICNSLYPLVHGKTLVLLPKSDMVVLGQLGRVLSEHRVTYMSSVPAVWKSVLRISEPPSEKTLRLVTCGSAPLSQSLWKNVQEWTGTRRVWNTYGITEMGSWIAGTSRDDVEPRDGLVGPGWGTDILIAPPMGGEAATADFVPEDHALPAGETGHIWLHSPTVMIGYHRRPELTRAVMSGSWFYTGDVGHISHDGDLVLSGRVRNEINFAGIKVIPEDVDLIVERHDSVLEACTFGMEDETAGEMVACAVVLDQGATITARALQSWSRRYLSDTKVPLIWFSLEEIPKTSRGKINRKDVAALCASKPRMR